MNLCPACRKYEKYNELTTCVVCFATLSLKTKQVKKEHYNYLQYYLKKKRKLTKL